MMKLRAALDEWDGKSAAEIHLIFEQYHGKAQFIESLISLMDSPLQAGATRLIKHYVESGESLSAVEEEQICRSIPVLDHWESKLHILQILHAITITSACKADVEDLLRSTLIDENKFLRAWAYNGFYLLATQYPEYRDEVRRFYILALRDESASVIARLRQSLRHDDWMLIDV